MLVVVERLSLADLAERSGVPTATLKVWRLRYGFPTEGDAFSEDDVDRARAVLQLRSHGVRLDAAIDRVMSDRY